MLRGRGPPLRSGVVHRGVSRAAAMRPLLVRRSFGAGDEAGAPDTTWPCANLCEWNRRRGPLVLTCAREPFARSGCVRTCLASETA